jgi:polyisoprenoid-binding protein YceI
MKTTWKIDNMHSEVQFKLKHLVISTVTGSFTKFSAEVETAGDNFENAKINFSADVNSISTGVEQRDEHLKNVDFFETAKFPTIDFVSTSFTKTGESEFKLVGNLTMHGVTKPVELDVEFGGIAKDHYGNIKSGFELSGKINRKDFGMQFNALTEAGGLMLGEEVKIVASVQFAKVVPAEKEAVA